MSIRLKSRRQCPPDGFQHKEQSTGWFLKTWDFEQLVQETIKHRRANPQFKLQTMDELVRTEIDTENAVRVLSIRNAEEFVISGGGPPPKTILPRSLILRRVVAAVGAGEKIASGAQLLEEWLGSGGKPVDKSLALRRASVCMKCPLNGKGDLSRFFTQPAAAAIRKTLEIKNDIILETPSDANLGVCHACLCPIKLKVWVPIQFILDHLSEQVRKELDPGCWMISEA